MNNYADLHIHTTASDGTFSMLSVLEGYSNLKYKVISVTDHDTIASYYEFTKDFYRDMRVIKGVEISTRYNNRDVHILGYNFQTNNNMLNDLLQSIRNSRVTRAKKMVSLLNEHGIDITYEDVLKNVENEENVGRPHIAQALVQKKYIHKTQEAFNKYIGDNSFAFYPKVDVSPAEAIEAIHSAGGFAVLAHPYFSINIENLPYFVKYGIDGLEAFYAEHNKKQTKYLSNYCLEHDLIRTGGSDFHGFFKNQKLGFYPGSQDIINDINKFLKHKIK